MSETPQPQDPRAERVARNERFFRDVNERLVQHGDRGDGAGGVAIACECGKLDCSQKITVPSEVYTAVRALDVTFLVVPGHEEPGVEVVETTTPTYTVVRKVGVAAEIAREQS